MATNSNKDIDEIAIKDSSMTLLNTHHARIQQIFNIELASGLSSKDGNRWLEIRGDAENRKKAMDYIKALCSPAENIDMEYSADLYPLLSNPQVHRKLEKQSNAVIIFPSKGFLSIMGSDTLSVTLALSAVEELMNKYLNQDAQTNFANGQLSPSSNLSSQRLNEELRRLSTGNQRITFEDDYYSNTNDAVKRTILTWMKDDNDSILEGDDTEDLEQKHSTSSQNTKSAYNCRSDLFNSKSKSDVNSNIKSPLKGVGGAVGGNVTSPHVFSSPIRNNSSNPELTLLSPESFVLTPRVSTVPTAKSVILPSSPHNIQPKMPGHAVRQNNYTSSLANEGSVDIKDFLYTIGVENGFSDEVIAKVFKKHGDSLLKQEFLHYAQSIQSDMPKSVETKQSVPSLFSLSNDFITGRAESQAKAVVPSSSASINQRQRSYKTSEGNSQENDGGDAIQGEDYLLALGLQSNFSEEVIEQVFKKDGRRLTAKQFLQSAMEINSEKGMVEAFQNDPPQQEQSLASKTLFPKAPTAVEMATNKQLQPEILKNKEHMSDYFNQLQRDFKEEENCDHSELIERNLKRRGLLGAAKEQATSSSTTSANSNVDMEVENIENWDEGMEVMAIAGTEDNKKRKHKNIEKGSGPRKTRWSPVDEKLGGSKETRAGNNRYLQNENHFTDTTSTNRNNRHNNQDYNHRGNNKQYNSVDAGTSGTNQPYTRDRSNRSPSPKNQDGSGTRMRNFSNSPKNVQQRSSPMNTEGGAGSLPIPMGLRANLRYIVIDGSNVAFHHGNHHVFSCKGIEIVVNYFLKKGHTEVTAFVPQWRTRTVQNTPIEDQHLLEDLRAKGYLVFTPARKINGKNIRTHDDNFVIRLAVETDGIVVTNDNFRDHYKDKPEWRNIIEKRLLMYCFAGSMFMPPEDPLGPAGPCLDEFLRKDTIFPPAGHHGHRNNFQQDVRPRDRGHSGSPKHDRQKFTDHHKKAWDQQQPNMPNQSKMTVPSGRQISGSKQWQQTGKNNAPQSGWQQGGGGKGAAGGGNVNLTWQQQNLIKGNEQNPQQNQQQQQIRPQQQQQQQIRPLLQQQNRQQQQNWPQQQHNRLQQPNRGHYPPSSSAGCPPLRSEEETQRILKELSSVFPNKQRQIQTVLGNLPRETDLEVLAIEVGNMKEDKVKKRADQQHNHPNQQQNNAQNRTAAPNQAVGGPPLRTEEETNKMFTELSSVFPDELVKIQRILQNHPRDTSLERLSIHLLDIMDS